MIYRFDEFEVDDREFRLSANGATLQVEPKVLKLLLYLIENRNRLVRKQELLDRVWPDAMVTENALTRVVGLLRKALNDDSHVPRLIETVPTAGYRFIARVTVTEQNPVIAPLAPIETAPATATSATRFRASRRWTFAALTLMLAAIGAGIFLFARHRSQIVHEKATVVLADFDNATGDPVFDGTLRHGLAVRLEQSPILTLLSDDRVQRALRMMGQPANARLSPAIAREICIRTSSAFVVEGSIASLGSQYVLGLRAMDCRSGKVFGQDQVQTARREDVLGALDRIASKLRARAGESLNAAEKYDTPIFEETTPSIEALRVYSLGRTKAYEGQTAAALLFMLRAVELDPDFASAYMFLSLLYSNRQEPERAAEAIRKAYVLRDRANERERRIIEANYFVLATGELEKAVYRLDVLKEANPGAPQPRTNLGEIYTRLGNPQKAMEEASEALRLEPTNPLHYQNLAADYVSLNRLDEANALYKQAEARGLVNEGSARSRYLLAFLKGDEAQMAQFASSTVGKPGEEDSMLAAQADTAAWFGKLKDARDLTRRAIDSAHRNDVQETAAAYQAEIALFETDSGNRQQGRADAAAAMKLAPTRDVRPMAALALAQSGDTAAAEKLADQLDKSFPRGILVQEYWLPAIWAAVALQHKDPNRAIEFLQVASAIERSGPRLLPAYLRGEAYLMLHDGNRAAAEFQKFLAHRGLVRNSPWGTLARLGLARAFAMQGNTVKAQAAYRDFLGLWKDADPDIPILKQAKAELTKLQEFRHPSFK